MFLAMNRFRIAPGREEDFINVWRARNSYLDNVPGFLAFHLLRGDSTETCAKAGNAAGSRFCIR